jgi:hypothetical protein
MEANVQKNDVAAFATEAKMPAKPVAPGDSLRLDLDFRWALSDLKVRMAPPARAEQEVVARR